MSFGMFLAGAASGAAQGYMMHKIANRKGGTAKPDGAMPEATPPAADATATPPATTPPSSTAGASATPGANGAMAGSGSVPPSAKPLPGTVGAVGSVKNPLVSDQMAFNDTFNQLTEQEGMVG